MRYRIAMRSLVFGACLLALASASTFVAPLRSQRQQAFDIPKGTNVLLGRVLDAGSDAPIAGVVVNLTGYFDATGRPLASAPSTEGASPPRSVMTNGDGYFIFRNLPAGRYVIMPLAFDYVSESVPQGVVELRDSDKPTSISVRLNKYAAITGRVFDESGDPLAGVSVSALQRLPIGGRLVLRRIYVEALTDDRGVYRLARLPPGGYVVAVISSPTTIPASLASEIAVAAPNTSATLEVLRQFGSGRAIYMTNEGLRVGESVLQRQGLTPYLAPDGRVLSYATTFFPGTPISADATVIMLGSGEERTTVDLPLRLLPTVRVSGMVTGPAGPMPRFGLRLVQSRAVYPTDGDPVGAANAITDSTGAFAFLAIAPGQYELQAWLGPLGTGANTPDRPLWAAQSLTVGDSDIAGVGIAMKPGIRVHGRVEFRSLTGAAPPTQPSSFVHLQPLGAELWGPGQGRVAPDGTFQTSGDPPGRYIINASAPPGWTMQTITRGGRTVDDGVIELDVEDVSGLVMTFSDKTTRVSGPVFNANGAPDAESHVVVFPADTSLWRQGIFDRRERLVQATSIGTFEIRGLMPGEYYIAAIGFRLTGGQANLWKDPQFLDRLIAGATRFTLDEGEERAVSLKTFTPKAR